MHTCIPAFIKSRTFFTELRYHISESGVPPNSVAELFREIVCYLAEPNSFPLFFYLASLEYVVHQECHKASKSVDWSQ